MELLKKYFVGLGFLVFDELSSFYRWITSILAMIISLWVYNVDDALPFSILLFFAITNIIVCAWWKGEVEDTKKEELQTKVYVINFILLLVIGCIINFTLMAIIVGVLIVLAIIYFVSNNFRIMSDNIFYIFWGIVFGLILPLGGLIYFIFQTTIPMYLKVLISVIYILITPLFSYLEDNLCACTVYELAECNYDPEFEEMIKEIEDELESNEMN